MDSWLDSEESTLDVAGESKYNLYSLPNGDVTIPILLSYHSRFGPNGRGDSSLNLNRPGGAEFRRDQPKPIRPKLSQGTGGRVSYSKHLRGVLLTR